MNRTLVTGIAIAAVLASSVVSYHIGAGRSVSSASQPVMTAAQPAAKRQVLYWQDPDGMNDYAASPKRTKDGRDYLPVYAEQEADFNGAAPVKPKGAGTLLYYRNPMGLADTSKVPKKDWMGMDYIPVYEGEEDASTVKISLDRVQRSGVRSEPARMQTMTLPVRASGIAKPDERTLRAVSLRTDGFIEKVYVNETGRHVTAGEPMFTVYSPQIVSALIDYQNTLRSLSGDPRGLDGALQRLRNYGVPDQVLKQLPTKSDSKPDIVQRALRTTADPHLAITWAAPMTGIVMQKSLVEGQMAKAGEELFRLADLSSIWVIANVAEQDIGMVRIGAPVHMSFRAYPGETFKGHVSFILHELEMATRTAKVRIQLANPDHRIKHEMFADVVIDTGSKDTEHLVVPTSAVIDSGNRQVVIIDKGEGRFEPRAVKLGLRSDDVIEVLDGLKAGEQVVTTATFLIDAESNLKATLQAFTAAPAAAKIGDKP